MIKKPKSKNLKSNSPRLKISRFFVAAILFLASITSLALSTPTHAANPLCSQSGVSEEVKRANGCSSDSPKLENVVVNIINGIVGALGLVAVIFIIVGGVNFMTSAGDSGKIQKAKNTILYATIGLVIAVLAFAIVNFVVANILNSGGTDDEDGRIPSNTQSNIISSNIPKSAESSIISSNVL